MSVYKFHSDYWGTLELCVPPGDQQTKQLWRQFLGPLAPLNMDFGLDNSTICSTIFVQFLDFENLQENVFVLRKYIKIFRYRGEWYL